MTMGLVSSCPAPNEQPVSVVASTADASATMVAERMGLNSVLQVRRGRCPVTAASPSSVEIRDCLPYGVREACKTLPMPGPAVKRGSPQWFRDGFPTCWGHQIFTDAHCGEAIGHSGVRMPVQSVGDNEAER
ncbi:hypothetical protein GCM10027259_17330 [Micromonospora palomenae]